MTTSYYADRANLYYVHQHHPDWSQRELAQALKRSESWVKKWLKRFQEGVPTFLPPKIPAKDLWG